ncbi:unnamed protein product [Prunus armeniaca]
MQLGQRNCLVHHNRPSQRHAHLSRRQLLHLYLWHPLPVRPEASHHRLSRHPWSLALCTNFCPTTPPPTTPPTTPSPSSNHPAACAPVPSPSPSPSTAGGPTVKATPGSFPPPDNSSSPAVVAGFSLSFLSLVIMGLSIVESWEMDAYRTASTRAGAKSVFRTLQSLKLLTSRYATDILDCI